MTTWIHLWRDVAAQIEEQVQRGRQHLLTEDSLRWATVEALERSGMSPDEIAFEYLLPDRGKVDLVVKSPPSIAVEFKFPRDSRTGISPDTMTMGELLKDLLRLSDPSIAPDRWAVMLLNERLRRYLERRTDCAWTFEEGGRLDIGAEQLAQLPQTAARTLRWSPTTRVQATCCVAADVRDLRLVAYQMASVGPFASGG